MGEKFDNLSCELCFQKICCIDYKLKQFNISSNANFYLSPSDKTLENMDGQVFDIIENLEDEVTKF